MKRKLISGLLIAAALALSGCTDALDSAAKAERPLPERLVRVLKSKGMSKSSPIMIRIFKEEGKLEVWKQKDNGRYDFVTDYDICKWSGQLGPKYIEGDRQAPEGFYTIRPYQMNPKSNYYLSFNIGFPNAYDRAHGRTGQHLMVHGACSSSGCYSMTDEQVAEIFAFGRDAFRGGQKEFQVQAYPFRLTPANMARYKDDPNIGFWRMLKVGYDHFELTKVPPKVDVCEGRYVFNQVPAEGQSFRGPSAACPSMSEPESLRLAYDALKRDQDEAFTRLLSNGGASTPPRPSIDGIKEARLVADWSKRRARGEKVSRQPPSLDVPARAPAPAARPEPKQEEAATEAVAAAEQPKQAPAEAATPVPQERPDQATADAEPKKKRWWNVF
ncbi:hypothetical protein CSC94_18140 [Zhengella mangrovi]|uniref:L,D-TPase catalytic domain-containing protein n=1 Tax=Zhengella mangrovi TaxID=1982044 RepID=A0A2G1QJ36_9HYPH|nr:murein L,D-transpeptidase family protein [Zhengella mangrovi]PHP65522.1 hypothetical protein CSC94_18140 [Zhengella mangrovi]